MVMLSDLRKTEIEYVKCFSEYYEDSKLIRFWDDNIPDMYSHNFTLLKDNASSDKLAEIISKEIELRKQQNKSFLQIEVNFPIDQEMIDTLPIIPEAAQYDYMYIPTNKHDLLRGNTDCRIEEAVTPETLDDGTKVDILANAPVMGEDFAKRRIGRKAQVYKAPDKNLNLFICYYNGMPVGNCELFISDNAKIEDFDILNQHQRKGLGTSVIKHLLKHARIFGVETAYIITDNADTAKEMYNKCGFSKIGEKTVLFFSL